MFYALIMILLTKKDRGDETEMRNVGVIQAVALPDCYFAHSTVKRWILVTINASCQTSLALCDSHHERISAHED